MSDKNTLPSIHFIGNHLKLSSFIFAKKRIDYLNQTQEYPASEYLFQSDKKVSAIFRLLELYIHRKKIIQQKPKVLHVYCLIDLMFLFFVLGKYKEIAFCISLYDLKVGRALGFLLRPFMKRVDHFYVSSRFITDQLWSLYDIPPSRITVLAITKYIERKDIQLIKVDRPTVDTDSIKIGCFLGASHELGPFVRFRELIRKSRFLDGQCVEIFLLQNEVNEGFLPQGGNASIKTETAHDIDDLTLDYWVVFAVNSPCPFINDALKQGATVITPSTHYTSELERVLKDKVSTYKAHEVSSAARLILEGRMKANSMAYERSNFSRSSWIVEREYLVSGYGRSVNRRGMISRS